MASNKVVHLGIRLTSEQSEALAFICQQQAGVSPSTWARGALLTMMQAQFRGMIGAAKAAEPECVVLHDHSSGADRSHCAE